MNAITLPKDLEAWAEAEVAAGRADSVETLTAKAVAGYRRQLAQLRESLDAAEAEAEAGNVHTLDEVFADLRSRYPDEA
jgi:predicted transcriptional regulator